MKKILAAIVIILALYVGTGFLNSTNFGLPLSKKAEKVAKQAVKAKDPTKCISLPIKEEIPAPSEDGKGLPRITYGRDTCLSKYLEATKDSQACELMAEAENKNTCYFQVAKNTNDISWCNKFDLTAQGNSHWDVIKAKNRCISYIAEVHSNPEVCNTMDSTDPAYWHTSVLCRAVATLDIKECDKFDSLKNNLSFAKTDCILAIVRYTHNDKDCLGITEGGYMSSDSWHDRNRCLKYAGCDKPEKRAELCSLIQYEKWTLQEEKDLCLEEKWECPEVYKRISQ